VGFNLKAIRYMVHNYKECLEFYRDVLGFEVYWGDETTVICDFKFGTAMIAFCDASATAEGSARASQDAANVGEVGNKTSDDVGDGLGNRVDDRAVLVFRVDDLDETCRQLRTRGVRFVTDPTDLPDLHVRAARFRDPAGNLLEINERLG